jgi:hypothetical protein
MNRASTSRPTVEELLRRIEELEARVKGRYRLGRLVRSRCVLTAAAILAALSVSGSSYASSPQGQSIAAAGPPTLPSPGKAGQFLRSNGTKWTSSSLQQRDIPRGYVDLSSDQTVKGIKTFNSTAHFGRSSVGMDALGNDGIEIGSPTTVIQNEAPYVDFHYGTGTPEDFNARLVNDGDGQLSVIGKRLRLSGANLQFSDGTTQRSASSTAVGGDVKTDGTPISFFGVGFTVKVNDIANSRSYDISFPPGSFTAPAFTPFTLATAVDPTAPVRWGADVLRADGSFSFTVVAPTGGSEFRFIALQNVSH